MNYLANLQDGLLAFACDVVEGFVKITRNGLALVGVAVLLAAALLLVRPDLRQQGEERLSAWLNARQAAVAAAEQAGEPDVSEPDASERATAANPADLPSEQARVALWIARKYHVAPEPVAALVAEAYDVGSANRIDPALVLAVMAVESSFNPFAQSAVGAQGLMQVMTHIHSDKYEPFGGRYAAFDPKTNLRVGAKVLQEYIARSGSGEAGLRMYVGAANLQTDGGYVKKVMAEYARLSLVAKSGPPAAGQQAAGQPSGPFKLAALF
jgi:soluble lytic murein transglycosylase-like protein